MRRELRQRHAAERAALRNGLNNRSQPRRAVDGKAKTAIMPRLPDPANRRKNRRSALQVDGGANRKHAGSADLMDQTKRDDDVALMIA